MTLSRFFRENKEKIPVSIVTFKKRFLTDEKVKELRDKGIIIVLGDKKRVIKILDKEAFFDYFFGGKKC